MKIFSDSNYIVGGCNNWALFSYGKLFQNSFNLLATNISLSFIQGYTTTITTTTTTTTTTTSTTTIIIITTTTTTTSTTTTTTTTTITTTTTTITTTNFLVLVSFEVTSSS